MNRLLSFVFCLGLFSAASSRAAEVIVQNYSSEHVKLYSDIGKGWLYEGTVRPGSRAQHFQSNPGDRWGFSHPDTGFVDIIKQITVNSWGTNQLTLNERDLNRTPVIPIIPGGQRNVTVSNYSSRTVTVYANRGAGWQSVGNVYAGSNAKFPVQNGEGWGIDDTALRGVNLVKEITIKSFDPMPGMTVSDRDLGVTNPIPPGPVQPKTITAINRSSVDLNLYKDDGRGYRYTGKIRSGSEGTFNTLPGNTWAFDDPNQSGINPVRRTVVKTWGTNVLSVSDSDIYGGGIFPAPNPRPGPAPAPVSEVSITFDNKSIHKGNVYLKTGPFSKSFLGTVGSWGAKTYRLTPGSTVVISKPGSIKALRFRVPTSSQTIPFKPRT